MRRDWLVVTAEKRFWIMAFTVPELLVSRDDDVSEIVCGGVKAQMHEPIERACGSVSIS